MKNFTIKVLSVILLTVLVLGMTACSSSTSTDPYADTSKLFASINRVERFTPGGMDFTKEQAEQIIALIDPVLNGAIYTTTLATDINKQVNGLLTKEQKNLLETTANSVGVPPEGMVPPEGVVPGTGGGGMGGGGMGGGGIPGTGTPGTGTPGTGVPTTGSSAVDYSLNMFYKVEQMLTTNYLND